MQSVYPPVNEITTKMYTDECEAAPAYSSVCTYAAVIRIVRKRCNTKKKKINTILWQQKLSWYLTQIDWWFTGLSFSDYFKEHRILNVLVLCLLSSFLSFRMWMSPHSWTKDKYAFPQRQEMKVICEKPRRSVLKIQIRNLLIINLKCIFIVPFIKTCYKDVLIWNLIME